MKKYSFLKLYVLFLLLLGGNIGGKAITYKLTKVTSVSSGNRYVFERNGRVLTIVNSGAIQTTDQYSLAGLSGNESYIWQLSSASDGFRMKMSDGKYLKNTDSTTMTSVNNSNNPSIWTFTFSDGVALIQNKSNNNRFLGDNGSGAYKAYTEGDLSSYSHDITVYRVDKMQQPLAPGEIMHETFDGLNDAATVSTFDYDGWTKTGKVSGENHLGCVKLAVESEAGSITTPVLSSLTTDAVLQISVHGHDEDETTLSVTGTNCSVEPNKITDIPTKYKTYTFQITNVGANPKITLSAAAGCRIYIDDVRIMTHAAVTLAASGYATYCSPYALDLTPTDDYAAYAVSSVSGTTVCFAKMQGRVAPQTPIVLYQPEKAGQTVLLPIVTDGEAVAPNLLRGTLALTPVTTVEGDYTNFGLSSGKFVRINDGTIKANKAFLPLLTSSLPSTSNARLSVAFSDETEEVDGIHAAVTSPSQDVFYDLQGRRITHPAKGLLLMRPATGSQQGKTVKVFMK